MIITPSSAILFLFTLLSSSLVDITTADCVTDKTQRDVGRKSFQWPRPAGGFQATSITAGLLVTGDVQFTATDTIAKGPVGAAWSLMEKEVGGVSSAQNTCTNGKTILSEVKVTVEKPDDDIGVDMVESYSLSLEGTVVTISSTSVWGARHGITTLHNMLELKSCNTHKKFEHTDMGGAGGYMFLPFADFTMNDHPRLRHRGLMIDTSRSYLAVATIKKILETMSRVKMNVLHWHATDDQSFPLVMKSSAEAIHGAGGVDCYKSDDMPCRGAYSNSKTYNEADIQGIIDDAYSKGIRVIIEVDMPSHARSWGVADKTLLECSALEHQTDKFCMEPPCGPLALSTNYSNVLALAKSIVDDIDRIARKGELVHFGMDEVAAGCWGKEERDALMKKWLADMTEYAAGKGRRIVVWQDVVEHSGDADKSVVPQVWDRPDQAAAFFEYGHDIIWSNYQSLYLDCGRGNPAVAGYGSWCDPYKTWWKVYTETPDLIYPEHAAKILGGEVCMWAEQANELTIESLLWPRAAAWAGASWEARTALPMASGNYNDDVLIPQEHLTRFSYTMYRDCVSFTPMHTQWCFFGDMSGAGADGTIFCDKYAEQYLSVPTTAAPTTTSSGGAAPTAAIGSATLIAAAAAAMAFILN